MKELGTGGISVKGELNLKSNNLMLIKNQNLVKICQILETKMKIWWRELQTFLAMLHSKLLTVHFTYGNKQKIKYLIALIKHNLIHKYGKKLLLNYLPPLFQIQLHLKLHNPSQLKSLTFSMLHPNKPNSETNYLPLGNNKSKNINNIIRIETFVFYLFNKQI